MAVSAEAIIKIQNMNEAVRRFFGSVGDFFSDPDAEILLIALVVVFAIGGSAYKLRGVTFRRRYRDGCPYCKRKLEYTRGEKHYSVCTYCLARRTSKEDWIRRNMAVFNTYDGGVFDPLGHVDVSFDGSDHESGPVAGRRDKNGQDKENGVKNGVRSKKAVLLRSTRREAGSTETGRSVI